MRNFALFFLFMFSAVCGWAQIAEQVFIGDHINVRQSIEISGRIADGIDSVLSVSSTHAKIPTAKAVVDYVDLLQVVDGFYVSGDTFFLQSQDTLFYAIAPPARPIGTIVIIANSLAGGIYEVELISISSDLEQDIYLSYDNDDSGFYTVEFVRNSDDTPYNILASLYTLEIGTATNGDIFDPYITNIVKFNDSSFSFLAYRLSTSSENGGALVNTPIIIKVY